MTDAEITMTIRRLLAAEKPKRTAPLDLLQVIRLLLQKSDEKDVYVSQDTLAEELCSSPDAIARSQKRLKGWGWISIEKGGYRGRTNKYCVMLQKPPVWGSQQNRDQTISPEDGPRILQIPHRE
jgi:biotin operon repressor